MTTGRFYPLTLYRLQGLGVISFSRLCADLCHVQAELAVLP